MPEVLKHNIPAENQVPVLSPWPFTQWGINIVGPLSTGNGLVCFVVIAVDCFTKWVEAELLATNRKQYRELCGMKHY